MPEYMTQQEAFFKCKKEGKILIREDTDKETGQGSSMGKACAIRMETEDSCRCPCTVFDHKGPS